MRNISREGGIMLHTLSVTSSNSFSIAQKLLDENFVNTLSYRKYLHMVANDKELALQILDDAKVINSLDGLDLSILGATHEEVALKIFSISALREKLYGVDLGELGSKSYRFAESALRTGDTKVKLKSYHIAIIGSAHPDLADLIHGDSFLFAKVEYIHYGTLAKNNRVLAEKLINEKAKYLEGVEIANIAKHHPGLAMSVVQNQALRSKIDTESLVIMANDEQVARQIFSDKSFYEQLGPIGISRILAKHEVLALEHIRSNAKILAEFEKVSTACIVVNSPEVAKALYTNRLYRSRTKIEEPHIAWIENLLGLSALPAKLLQEQKKPNPQLMRTFEKHCISFLLKNQIQIPMGVSGKILENVLLPLIMKLGETQRRQVMQQLIHEIQRSEIEELVTLGHQSLEVATDILETHHKSLTGSDLVVLCQNFPSLIEKILTTSSLNSRLKGIDLVMLVKDTPRACKQVLENPTLRNKIVGCHAGVLALKSPELIHLILGDENIRANLTQKDVPLLCKRYIGVMKLALKEVSFHDKFSGFYLQLLRSRSRTVEAISQFIRGNYTDKNESENQVNDRALSLSLKMPFESISSKRQNQKGTTQPIVDMVRLKISPNGL